MHCALAALSVMQSFMYEKSSSKSASETECKEVGMKNLTAGKKCVKPTNESDFMKTIFFVLFTFNSTMTRM